MKKIVFGLSLVFTLLFTGGMLYSQNADFSEKIHDFGTIEADGAVSHKFIFTNTGDKPLVISNVRGCCGLSISGWTKEPVAPQAEGYVEATVHTKGRKGGFDKNVTVTTNGTPQTVNLKVKGNIAPTPADLKAEFAKNIGLLRLKRTNANFMTVDKNSGIKLITLETANAETTPVSIKFDNIPDYYTVTAEPQVLQPKQKGLIKIVFDPLKKKALGYSQDFIAVNVGEQKGNIELVSTLMEKGEFAEGQQPRLVLKETLYDFGTTKINKSVTASYQIANDGSSDLILYNVTTGTENIKSTVNKVKVKPGKSAVIKLAYVGNEQGTKNINNIYLTTNDPSNPLVTLAVKGIVE